MTNGRKLHPRRTSWQKLIWRDLRQVVDEEVQHVSEAARPVFVRCSVLVLCDLFGKALEEAVQLMDWTAVG